MQTRSKRQAAQKGEPEEETGDEGVRSERVRKRKLLEATKEWFKTVAGGRETKVAKLLAADPTLLDAVSQDNNNKQLAGFTALHVAAYHGLDTIVAQLLAEKPALVDSRVAPSSTTPNETGSTALHVAAAQDRDDVVEVLLAAKSSVMATDLDGRTALHYAARAKDGSCRMVELLLAATASPAALLDARDEEGHTALLSAIKARYIVKASNEAVVNQLLSLSPTGCLDAADSSGMTALHYAIIQGDEALTWRMLEARPDLVQSASRNGLTPLRMATGPKRHASPNTLAYDKMALQLFLLNPQAATDFEKGRLLQFAVYCGDSDLDLIMPNLNFDQIVDGLKALPQKSRLRLLVEKLCGPLSMVLSQDVMGIMYEYLFGVENENEDTDMDDNPCAELPPAGAVDRKRQWFQAVRKGNEKLITQLLIDDPTLIDAVHREEGYTALHFASFEGKHDVVTQLVAAKPSLVYVGDHHGTTALHLAASVGFTSIVEMLLASSPTVGLIVNTHGTTALMYAAMHGRLEAAELLLTACPSALDLVDRHHCTALLHACFNKHFDLVRLLLTANPQNFESTGLGDNNVLHHVVCYGRADLVAKILKIEPRSVHSRTWKLQTPLWLAVENEHNEIIEQLFVHFPQAVRIADENGVTPFQLARQLKNDFAIGLFLPKLTFDEIVRGFRKCHDNARDSNERRLRAAVDAQCEDVAKLLVPSAMDIVYAFLGFGSLTVHIHFADKNI